MKRTELILLTIWVGFFALRTIDYPGRTALMFLTTIVLGLYYVFMVPKHFSGKSTDPLILSIFSGISFGIALFAIPLRAVLYTYDWIELLPIPIIVLTIILIANLVYHSLKKKEIHPHIKHLFGRSLIIGLLSSFFAFSTLESSAFRVVVYPLNNGNEKLQSNILMFRFHDEASDYLRNGECEKAEKSAIRSFQEGLKWISLRNEDIPHNQKLTWIHGTIENSYKAYRCIAERFFNDKNFEKALTYRLKADSILSLNPIEVNNEWKGEQADSKNEIGICYDRLNQNDSAAAYYIKAINYYSDSVGNKDNRLATYFYNLGHVFGEDRFFEESNQMLQGSIKILELDTTDQNNKEDISLAYLRLAYNGLSSNKLDLAKESLKSSYKYLTPSQFCEFSLYSSIYSTRKDEFNSALEYAKEALSCYTREFGDNNQNVAESHSILYDIWMNIPNYDSALTSIQRGKEITSANHGNQSVRFHDYEKREAYYFYIIGDYSKSLNGLLNVEKVYRRELGKESDKLPEVLATIGRIKVEQGAFNEALKYGKESLRIAQANELFIDDRASNLLNDIAYINYATNQNFIADTLYNKSIDLNIEANQDSSLSVASALNGLGLLATRKSQFFKADSLFNQSLELYQYRTSDLHPDKGIVLMNRSELSFKRRNFSDALELINQALDNFTPFHRDNHPTIADMYGAKAVILIMKDERTQAKALLTKALEIYESNFQPEHSKIRETRNRLGAMDNSR